MRALSGVVTPMRLLPPMSSNTESSSAARDGKALTRPTELGIGPSSHTAARRATAVPPANRPSDRGCKAAHRALPSLSERLPNASIERATPSKELQNPSENFNSFPGFETYQRFTGEWKEKKSWVFVHFANPYGRLSDLQSGDFFCLGFSCFESKRRAGAVCRVRPMFLRAPFSQRRSAASLERRTRRKRSSRLPAVEPRSAPDWHTQPQAGTYRS